MLFVNKLMENKKINTVLKYSSIKYIALVIGFLKGIVNAKFLGPELLGLIGNLLLILSYLSYANLGILNSMLREYPIYEEKDESKANDVLNTSFTFIVLISILFIIMAIGSIILFNIEGKSNYSIYYALIFVIAIFEQFRLYYINYFRLKNEFRAINKIELINNVASMIIILLLIIPFKINGILIAMLIADIYIFIYCYKSIKGIKLKINKIILVDLIKLGIPLVMYNIGYYIMSTVDRLMIISYLNYRDLGYYTFAYQMVSACIVFLTSILFIVYPTAIKKLNIGYDKSKKRKEEVIRYVSQYCKKMELVSIVLLICGLVGIELFVKMFFKEYSDSVDIFRLLCTGAVFFRFSSFENIYLVSNKKQIRLTILLFICIILVWLFNCIFLQFGFGLKGISLATMLINIIYCIIQTIIFLFDLQQKDKLKYIFSRYYKVCTFVIVVLIATYYHVNMIIYLGILLAVATILYLRDVINIIKESL